MPDTRKGLNPQVIEVEHEATQFDVRREPLKDRLWLFEVFAWCLSAPGLAAIAVILVVTEDKQIPTWSRKDPRTCVNFEVTINSVTSLFSTLLKSTLLIPVVASLHQLKWLWFKEERPLADVSMFEGAGKGPLGVVMLIWQLRGRAVACLGVGNALFMLETLTERIPGIYRNSVTWS